MYSSGIYRKSPQWAQSLLISGRGLVRGLLREGRGLRAELQDVQRSERLDAKGLEALQVARIRHQLLKAGQEVPYYRELFRRERFDPQDFHHLSDLGSLPILEKSDVQAAGAALCSEAKLGLRFRSSTSGSTGGHMTGWRDLRSIVARKRLHLAPVDLGRRAAGRSPCLAAGRAGGAIRAAASALLAPEPGRPAVGAVPAST